MRGVARDLGDDTQLFSLSTIELDYAADVGGEDIYDLKLTVGAKRAGRYLVPPARAASYGGAGGDKFPRFVEYHYPRPRLGVTDGDDDLPSGYAVNVGPDRGDALNDEAVWYGDSEDISKDRAGLDEGNCGCLEDFRDSLSPYQPGLVTRGIQKDFVYERSLEGRTTTEMPPTR